MASRSFFAGLAVIAVILVALGATTNAFDPREGGRGFAPNRGHSYEQFEEFDQNCTLEVDLMIAIDGSSSITDEDWQEAVSFLYDIVLGFKLGPNAAQIGVVQFTTQYETYVYCNLTDSVTQLQEGLQHMNQIGGGTNIAEGIMQSQDQIDEHGRSGVPHVIIVITDGQQDDPGSNLNPVTAAGNAKLGGSVLFGIGVGDQVDTTTMHQVVNSPWQNYYFPVSGYSNLSSILQKTVLSICHPSTTSATAAASSGNSQSSQSSQTSTGGSQSSQSSNSQSSTGGSQSSQSSNSQSSNSQSSSTGSQSSGQSSTGGGHKCGNFNTCAFGDFCCSDGNNPNDPFYCCAGADRCCEGSCCRQGYECYNGQCVGGF